ncbi:hypothetical protein QBC44DRAFT_366211 [Cladorrhinum sp. PSN332]|nr:hypothetical protein QBC44DRAFT_366211 [Cladorrhinum sp. PSN332]
MATNPAPTPTQRDECTSSATSSKSSLVQPISKLRNRIFSNSTTSPASCSNTGITSAQQPEKSPQLPSMAGSFPSNSSVILTRRLADKHALFTSKLDSLNQSFHLGLLAQGISDPESVQTTLLRYHQSTHPQPERMKPHSKDRPFHLIRRPLSRESLIVGSSLSRKICLGSRLKTCMDLVSALESTTTSTTTNKKRTPPQPQTSLNYDADDDEPTFFSFWESHSRTCPQNQQTPSSHSPGLSSSSSNSAPSTPGCYSSFSFSNGGILPDHENDNESRPQSPNTEPDSDLDDDDAPPQDADSDGRNVLLLLPPLPPLIQAPKTSEDRQKQKNKEKNVNTQLQIPQDQDRGPRDSTYSITPSSSGESIYYSMDDEERGV